MTTSVFGFHDAPADTDSLSIDSYIKGLTTFISSCPTPMTLAVQGNWGTGKTSAMLQIKKELAKRNDFKTVFFNTWQYSQFDLGENLPISMLKAIASGLGTDASPKQENKRGQLLDLIKKAGIIFARKSLPSLAGLVPGGFGTSIATNVIDSVDEANAAQKTELYRDDDLDSVEILSNLREAFAQTIQETGQTVVVFIDDLDRLNPGRAIEVMEAIKVFLDVERCIFVLAIDFEVVLNGVKEKYGREVSERKARSFFDKIIQVPFHMPVSKYQMQNFFEEGLKLAKITTTEEQYVDYHEISVASVGFNPRSTKRLLNTFLLLKTILDCEQPQRQTNYLHTFGTLCMQTAFPEAYDALLQASYKEEASAFFLKNSPENISSEDPEHAERAEQVGSLTSVWKLPKEELPLFERFYDRLTKLFEVNDEFNDSAFNEAFQNSTITSVSTSDAGKKSGATRTFDRLERTNRALEKSTREIVDLGLAFETAFATSQNAFAAQSNPKEWTVRKAAGRPRLGMVFLQAKSIKLQLEFKQNKPMEMQNADLVEKALTTWISALPEENRPSLARTTQTGKNYDLISITRLESESQVNSLAATLKNFYQ